MTSFLTIHNIFLDNLSSNDPFFDVVSNLSNVFDSLVKNVSKFVFWLENWQKKKMSIFNHFWSFHWMTPFWRKKNLLPNNAKTTLVSSCCRSTPVTSKVEGPEDFIGHYIYPHHHGTNSSWLPKTSRNRLVNIDEPHMTRYDLIFSLACASRLYNNIPTLAITILWCFIGVCWNALLPALLPLFFVNFSAKISCQYL